MRRRFLSGPGACTGGVEGVEEVVRGGAAGAQCQTRIMPDAARFQRSRSAHGMRMHMDGRRAYLVPGGVDMTSKGRRGRPVASEDAQIPAAWVEKSAKSQESVPTASGSDPCCLYWEHAPLRHADHCDIQRRARGRSGSIRQQL